MTSVPYGYQKKNQGFTLIELVVVIIILGIMMTTVIPKFFSSRGFEEHAYRSETVATLRAIQLQAMQQSNLSKCHLLTVSANVLGLNATDINQPRYCDFSVFADQGNEEFNRNTSVVIADEHTVTFTTNGLGNVFGFDSLGRAVDINGNLLPCNLATPCQIIITGEDALVIQIEAQGYIHGL